MGDTWTYLVGSEDSLSPVWKAYYIDPYVHGPGSSDNVKEAGTAPKSQGGGVSALVEQSGRVHTLSAHIRHRCERHHALRVHVTFGAAGRGA